MINRLNLSCGKLHSECSNNAGDTRDTPPQRARGVADLEQSSKANTATDFMNLNQSSSKPSPNNYFRRIFDIYLDICLYSVTLLGCFHKLGIPKMDGL